MPRLPAIRDRAGALRDRVSSEVTLRRIRASLRNAEALEIGGPSALFRRGRALSVYGSLRALDALDFSDRTLWGTADDFPRSIRRRFQGEAALLPDLTERAYDAVLASHVLEHLAKPIGALRRWSEVLRDDGVLLLVVPHREGTFDHRRAITPLTHLLEDAARGTTEDDLTHLEEILQLHDHEKHPVEGGPDAFAQRGRNNFVHRALHHHAFDTSSLVAAVRASGLKPEEVAVLRPYHIVLSARSSSMSGLTDCRLRHVLATSPFAGDRTAGAD